MHTVLTVHCLIQVFAAASGCSSQADTGSLDVAHRTWSKDPTRSMHPIRSSGSAMKQRQTSVDKAILRKKTGGSRVLFAQKSRDGYQEIGTSHLRIDWNNSGWKWRGPEFLDNMTAMASKELTWFVGDTMRVKNHIYAKVPWTCPAGTRKQMAENQTWKKA